MRKMERKDRIAFLSHHVTFLSLATFLFILQVVFRRAALVRYIDIFTTIFIMGIFALSFDLLLGYVGLLNFGQALFFGMGAYITAYTLLWTPVPYFVAMVIATLVGAGLGFLLSYLVRRAFYGVPFTFTSLAFAMIVYFLYRKRELLPISGGEEGLVIPIPEIVKSSWWSAFFVIVFSIVVVLLLLAVFSRLRRQGYLSGKKIGCFLLLAVFATFLLFVMWRHLMSLWAVEDYMRITPNFYFFSLTILCICYLLAKKFASSPVGHVWTSIRENEVRAGIIGFNVFRYKLLALMVSSGLAALAGGIYAPYSFVVSPDAVFTPMLSIYAIIYVVIGGLGTLSGALLGTTIVIFLERFLIDYIGGWGPVVIGGIFIACVLGLPYGIVGTWRAKGLSMRAVLQKLVRWFTRKTKVAQ